MNIRWLGLLVVVVIALGSLAYVYDRHRKFNAGYCFDQGRYLTDDEIVDGGIAFLIEALEKPLARRSIDGEQEFVTYESVEAFKRLNPDCCLFSSEVNRTWWNSENASSKQAYSSYGKYVNMVNVTYRKLQSGGDQIRTGEVQVFSCGEGRRYNFDHEMKLTLGTARPVVDHADTPTDFIH